MNTVDYTLHIGQSMDCFNSYCPKSPSLPQNWVATVKCLYNAYIYQAKEGGLCTADTIDKWVVNM